MKTYTVHRRAEPHLHADPGNVVLVKEGFAWLALFFPFLWLLFHRMWLPVLAWLAISVALSVVGNVWPEAEGTLTIVAIVFGLWFAFEANAIRRWSLGRKGWEIVDVVVGRDWEEAELAHFRRAEAERIEPVSPTVSPAAAARDWRRTSPHGGPMVGGLFPEGRGR